MTDVGTNVSVGFTDRTVWRLLEPGTPAPQVRLDVCRTLNEGGIGCGVLMAPIIPFLTDGDAQLEETVRAIAESGATHVSPIVLHLRTGAREWFLAWLAEHHPELVQKYELLYRNRAVRAEGLPAGDRGEGRRARRPLPGGPARAEGRPPYPAEGRTTDRRAGRTTAAALTLTVAKELEARAFER